MEVELLAVDRGLVDLEVAGVDEHAERRVDGEPDAVRHAVRDAQELDLEGADLDDVLRPDGPEGVVGEIVFVEFGADERQRQRRAVDRTIDVRQQVGDGPDVVFVPVREHERGDAALLQVGEVGNDEVDAEELDVGERHPGVDDETRVPVRNRHEVHAEFAEAAQRDDFKSRVAGERIAVPGRGARHRSSLHGAAGGFDPNGARSARRPHSRAHDDGTRTSAARDPHPGLVRSSRGHDHRPGRRHRVRSDRWDGPKEAENRANYSTESGIRVSARRTNSSGVRVSGRRMGSTPAPCEDGGQVQGRRAAGLAGGGQGPQRVRQRLAALLERRPHQPVDRLEPRHRHRRRPERQPDDRRVDLRRRPEGARRQRQDARPVREQAEHHRQRAVVAAAGAGEDAVGDLALQHHRGVADPAGGARQGEDAEQDRRRQVVGQVADDAHRAAPRRQHAGVVEGEEVAGDERQRGRDPFGERRGEVAVDLDGANGDAGRGERPGQRAEAGPDLDEDVVRGHAQAGHELGRPGGLEEVLAEALAGAMLLRPRLGVRRVGDGVAGLAALALRVARDRGRADRPGRGPVGRLTSRALPRRASSVLRSPQSRPR